MAVYRGLSALTLIYPPLNGTRRYSLSTVSGQAGAVAGDKGVWEFDPGARVVLFFRNDTEGTPVPGTANSLFTLTVETVDGSQVIRTLYSDDAPPAQNASFEFWATSNGLAGGAKRCGPVRLVIRAVRTGDLAIGNYDRNNKNNTGSGLEGVSDPGLLRARAEVVSLAASAPPGGELFALPPSGAESVTLSAAITPPFLSLAEQQVSLNALDGAAPQLPNFQAVVPASGAFSRVAAINQANFDLQRKFYGLQTLIVGNSRLAPESGAVAWTVFKAGEQNVIADAFEVDPRATVTLFTGKSDADDNGDAVPDAPAAAQFFIGADTAYAKARVQNARGEPCQGFAVATTLRRGATVEQSLSGGVTLANGWQDSFYAFNVLPPAGARTLTSVVTRSGDTGTGIAEVEWVPSYTGNLGLTLAVDPLDEARERGGVLWIKPHLRTAENIRQSLVEAGAVGSAVIVDVWRYQVEGLLRIRAGAPAIPVDADTWAYEIDSLPPGAYLFEVAASINAGQVNAQAHINVERAGVFVLGGQTVIRVAA